MIGSTAQALSSLGRASLFTTGSLMVVAGSAITWLRSAPRRLLGVIERRFVVEVEIRDDWTIFDWTLAWLAAHPSMRRNRKWSVVTRVKSSDAVRPGIGTSAQPEMPSANYTPEIEPVLIPGFGTYLLWFERRPVVLTRSQEESKGNQTGSRPRQQVTMRMLTRRRERMERLLKLIAASGQSGGPDMLRVVCANGEGWYPVEGIAKRALETVILPAGMMEQLTADIEAFLANKSRYRHYGIPYHRGYGLFGPPGGGKTSLVQALAGHFNLVLHVLNLSSIWSDEQLFSLVRRLSPASILLIEDIDAALSGPRQPDSNVPVTAEGRPGVSLSALLNVLDGVYSKDGMITFLTSNHPQRLDPALLRDGRIDVRIDLEKPTPGQALRLRRRFVPDSGPFAENEWVISALTRGESMARLQGELARQVFQPLNLVAEQSVAFTPASIGKEISNAGTLSDVDS